MKSLLIQEHWTEIDKTEMVEIYLKSTQNEGWLKINKDVMQ